MRGANAIYRLHKERSEAYQTENAVHRPANLMKERGEELMAKPLSVLKPFMAYILKQRRAWESKLLPSGVRG